MIKVRHMTVQSRPRKGIGSKKDTIFVGIKGLPPKKEPPFGIKAKLGEQWKAGVSENQGEKAVAAKVLGKLGFVVEKRGFSPSTGIVLWVHDLSVEFSSQIETTVPNVLVKSVDLELNQPEGFQILVTRGKASLSREYADGFGEYAERFEDFRVDNDGNAFYFVFGADSPAVQAVLYELMPLDLSPSILNVVPFDNEAKEAYAVHELGSISFAMRVMFLGKPEE